MQPENPSFQIANAEVLAERLFTIGHSNHTEEALLGLLRRHGVTAVADVRSSPYSRRMPHFSRGPIEAMLRNQGITYVFLGKELGGRPSDESLYHPEGWADYERMRETESFRQGIIRVVSGLERFAIALLCGEEDPLDCHRGLMITPALKALGLPPRHIRRDGVETTARFEERLQDKAGVGGFLIDEAYRVMNRSVAFRLEVDEWNASGSNP